MRGRWIATITSFAAATVAFGAVALAQTPSPGATGTPSASATAGTTTTPATTGTAGMTMTTTPATTGTARSVTGTVTTVVTGSATAVTTPVPTIPVATGIYAPGGQGDFRFAHGVMQQAWNRTDKPVADSKVSRTWFWGPGPNTPGLLEPYAQAPAQARGQRLVQYFDKSRMEVNDASASVSQPFFVTNGLLTVELISGFVQVGDAQFNKFRSACIPMAGDFGDTLAPTYFAFQGVSNTQAGDHFAQDRTGQNATEMIDRDGKVSNDAAKASVSGVRFAHYETQTRHNIPAVFWDFLNSSGPVYNANGQTVNEQLIVPWFYASGLPISEPYWTKARVRGSVIDVLIQAFERRALTFVPTNPQGFQVEMANIGQHYFDWRYRNFGVCPGTAPGTPTPPVPAPTGTAMPGTPQATGTVVSGTGTPRTTGTVVTTTTPRASVTGTIPAEVTVTAVTSTTPVSTTPLASVTGTTGTTTATPVGTRVP